MTTNKDSIAWLEETRRNALAANEILAGMAVTTDYILWWPQHCLAVGFTADHKSFACGVHNAATVATHSTPEDAYAFIPNVSNGRGEPAILVRRSTAAERAMADNLDTIKMIDDNLAKIKDKT